MLIDSHCHLIDPRYTTEEPPLTPDQLVEEARNSGVAHCIAIACERADWQPNLAFAARHPAVSLAVGIHPYHAGGEGGMISEKELLEMAQKNPYVVAFGETGLDYSHHNTASKKKQFESFHIHLQAAEKAQLPVVVHTRDAEEDTLAILREHPHIPFVLHCFTGSKELAEGAIGQGGYISFSGILTFKKARELREIAASLPRDKVLLETDAPYLAPEPFRSRRNAPSLMPHTAETLAKVWQISPAEAAQITAQNTRRLFTRLQLA